MIFCVVLHAFVAPAFFSTWKIRTETGMTLDNVPASNVRDRRLSIYWRMLRPEFVKGGVQLITDRVGTGLDWFIDGPMN